LKRPARAVMSWIIMAEKLQSCETSIETSFYLISRADKVFVSGC